MERTELIRYLHVVLDLENAAQFCRETTEQLALKIQLAERQRAALSVKPLELIAPPTEPVFPKRDSLWEALFHPDFDLGAVIGFISGGFVAFWYWFIFNRLLNAIILGVTLGLAIKFGLSIYFWVSFNIDKRKNYFRNELPRYKTEVASYEKYLEKYHQQEIVYLDAVRTNEVVSNKLLAQIESFEKERSQVLSSYSIIDKKLRQLYAEDIIYSKYRNLVALSYITDYIESGIANELTGPNGAYAQYENDARTQKICNSLDELKEIVKTGFSNVLHAQSQIYQALVEIRGGVYQIQRSVDNVYSALGQAASTLGTLLKNEQEFSERTSQQLAQIRQATEVTAKDTSMIAFNQYINAKINGIQAYYTFNV